jgi:cation diffusion facilitator family transporter
VANEHGHGHGHGHGDDHAHEDHTHDAAPIQAAAAEVEARGESRTRVVIAITFVMMIAEIVAGFSFGSMSLVADGWHMGSHAAALGITLFAYRFARNHRADPRFAFGTGKVTALGGFASGACLGFVALLMVGECIERAIEAPAIRFDEALIVACIGFAVNLVSVILLRESDHGHGHGHGADDHDHVHDHNLRAAYLHVLADLMTSLLAILALFGGKIWDLRLLDPIAGVLASFVVLNWTIALLRQSGGILLDRDPAPDSTQAMRAAIESELGAEVLELRVWPVGATHRAALVTTRGPATVADVRRVGERFGPFALLHVEAR